MHPRFVHLLGAIPSWNSKLNARHTNILVLLTGLNLLIHIENAVPQACATLQTYNPDYPVAIQSGSQDWDWQGTGIFTLDQNSNGLISGGLASIGNQCFDAYSTTGTINTNAGFSLMSNDETSPSLGCTSTLYMNGTVNGAGCTVASGSWHNTSSQSGSFSMAHGCFVPLGETNQVFQGWAEQNNSGTTYEVANFQVQIAPLSYNWGGRTISETFPQAAVDGCWFPNSAVPKVVSIATKSVTVDSTGSYSDSIGPIIGPAMSAVTYYRQKGRTPCSVTLQQVMVIDCPNPPANPTYATNTIVRTIGPLLLTITRGNNPSVSEVFGPPAPARTLPAILFNLLSPPH